MVDVAAIEELLESGERQARENDAKKRRGHASGKQEPSEDDRRVNNKQDSFAKEESYVKLDSGDDERRGDRYTAEREQNNQRRSRRSRDLAEDEEMRDASDRGSANGSSARSKHRSRSAGSDRRGRRSSRDRNDFGRGGGDFYSGGGRRPPTNRSDDDRYRPGSGDRQNRDRGRERSPRRRDDNRGNRDYRRRSPDTRRAKTPEPTDDERDRRTVFVQQLAARLRSKELRTFFEAAGAVVDAQIVKDRVSGRSKGVGYVEFKEEESVEKAIALTGKQLAGIPIIVQLTEAEKNRLARTSEGTATQSNGIPFHRLYVGNIHFSITEDDLRQVFEPFGELEFVQLQKEEQGRSKGYGFVQFIDPAQAKEALEKMNGFELAGRAIRVGLGNDKFTTESTQNLLSRFRDQNKQTESQGSGAYGTGGRGTHAGGSNNFDRASGRDVDKAGGASALDDTDVGGVNFSNYSRDALMRKLARTDEPEEKIAPKTTQQQKQQMPIAQAAASRCVLLKNMYNQAEETEPGWQDELKEEVRYECQKQYGKIVHIGLALDNNDGEIYLKFEDIQGGQNAINGLNGRWFGGRMITAQFVVDAVYNMNFPKAQNL